MLTAPGPPGSPHGPADTQLAPPVRWAQSGLRKFNRPCAIPSLGPGTAMDSEVTIGFDGRRPHGYGCVPMVTGERLVTVRR